MWCINYDTSTHEIVVDLKRNEEDFHILQWSNLQDILLCEKKKEMQRKVYVECTTIYILREEEAQAHTQIHFSLKKKTTTKA